MCAFQMITFLFSLLDLMHQLLFLFLFLAYEISGEVIYILFIITGIMNLIKTVNILETKYSYRIYFPLNRQIVMNTVSINSEDFN